MLFPRKPKLSVVVNAYNMTREMKRTIHSLSPGYQCGVKASDYEVIVVDNGSVQPLSKHLVLLGQDGVFDFFVVILEMSHLVVL